ncbi:MAG: ABC transporter substrate-binding protein [Chloroflexi bacterium]|nr:ABC transporter substrate-binding protein [Chloroflexota bacterium]
MTHKRWIVFSYLVGGALLLAAACAPAAAPKPAGEQPAAAKPAAAQPGAQAPTAPGPAGSETKAGITSLNGIPLEKDAKFGGILRSSYSLEGPTFSMWEESGGVSWNVGHPVTNMIVQRRSWGTPQDAEKQAFFEIYPDLAKSWEQSKDGLRWTFTFHEGVKWSDGAPFTCADAKWSLDTIRTGTGLKRSPRATLYTAVSEIQCPSDLTMTIVLKQPKPALLDVLAAPLMPILPKHKYDGNTDELRQKPWSVGTGPFVVKEWVPQEKYVLAKREDYWNKPFPYLDGLQLNFLTSAAAGSALRAGRLDFTGNVYGGPADTLIKECKECQIGPRLVSQGATPVMMINHQRPPWNNPLIKDAISLALDRKKISSLWRGGGWTIPPSGGVFYPGSFWAMPKERLSQIPGYNFDTPEENKAKARELLAKAGYKPGELTMPLGIGVYNNGDEPLFIEDLQAVGFKVVTTAYEVGRTYDIMGSGDFDAFVAGFWDGGVDPDFALYEQFYTGSDRNYNRWSNREYDRLVNEMSQTLDPEKRRQKAWDAGEIALKEHAKFYVGMSAAVPIYGPRLRGLIPAPSFLNSWGPWLRHEHTWLAEK